MNCTFKQQWRDYVRKEYQSYVYILANEDYINWERNRMPEETAADQIGHACVLLYGDDDSEMAKRFLRRGVDAAKAILSGGTRCSTERFTAAPSLRLATARLVKCLGVGLLREACDLTELGVSADAFVEWALTGEWDDTSEYRYLVGIRLHLLSGNFDGAAQLLATRRKFRWHAQELTILRELDASGFDPSGLRADITHYDEYFDTIRSPDFQSSAFFDRELSRLELGLIRDKFFISSDSSLDWGRTIDAVSR